MTFEVCFSFFYINTESKNATLDILSKCSAVKDYAAYEDEDDLWCIDCIANVSADSTDSYAIRSAMEKMFGSNSSWDYHYIKGIDNDFYWDD